MTSAPHSDLELFANSVVSRLGFPLNQHNAEDMEHALRQALERTGSKSLNHYLARFEDSGFANKEVGQIALALTVPETYFFRHAEQFRALAEVALPQRVNGAGNSRRLNLLSAGCASGEEAYSLAARLAACPNLQDWQLRVRAMDINAQLVAKARRARYSEWSLRALPESERPAYFHQEGRDYVLKEKLRSMVVFKEGNLLDPEAPIWEADFYDIIFCRNVMIYFSPAAVRVLVAQLTHSLAPGGFLFLGPSETLRGLSQQFHLRHSHEAFYYQRKQKDEEQGIFSPAPAMAQAELPLTGVQAPASVGWASAIAQSSQRIAALAGNSPSSAARATPNPGAAFPALQDLEELRSLLREERFEDAQRAIDALSGESATDSDVLIIQAVLLANRGEPARAMQICDQLLARDELRPGAHYLKAVCQETRGDHFSAAEHDQTAIYLDPKFAMPRLHLGLLARRLGDLPTARRELAEALALLAREDAARIVLFGGGFSREALIRFCEAQLKLCGDPNAQ